MGRLRRCGGHWKAEIERGGEPAQALKIKAADQGGFDALIDLTVATGATMAKPARRKRKPAASSRKRRRVVDLLDLPPSAFVAKTPPETSPEELLEGEKAWERIRRALEAGPDDQPEELLEWEKAWVQIGRQLETWSQNLGEALEIRPVLELPDDWASSRRRSEPKNRLQPQQELCRRVFRKLFPDGRIPDEVELNTASLRQTIKAELEREAKQAGKKPLQTPSWDVVRVARRKFVNPR
jgi:hypothetical protein